MSWWKWELEGPGDVYLGEMMDGRLLELGWNEWDDAGFLPLGCTLPWAKSHDMGSRLGFVLLLPLFMLHAWRTETN
jgi:hypothetical protein